MKIGIGCVTAHAQVGFSGGGNIILPGVAHIDSIAHYHLGVQQSAPETTGLARWDENVMRFNIEEAAKLVGLDFKVDVVVNEFGEPTHAFAGEFLTAHAQAVALAKEHYATAPRPRGKQVMICNAFCKPNEMTIAYLVGLLALEKHHGPGTQVGVVPSATMAYHV